MKTKSGDWFQMVITDTNCLSGDSVHSFMRPLIHDQGARFVSVRDIEGAVTGFSKEADELDCIDAENFLQKVKQAVQYDWAYFFLYRDCLSSSVDKALDHKELVASSD